MSTDQISDLAISGDGFFQVQTATGVAYTRDGAFTVDGQGYLGSPGGNRLFPNIQVPANATHIQVSRDGMVTGFFADGSTSNLGQIQLATFSNSGGLVREGGNLYSPSGASGAPQLGIPGAGGRGTLISGFLETSNVDLATEMTNSMVNSDEFKMNIQVAKTADEMMKNLLDLKA
jgi:flagellar basal-body rod protein FlgG